MSEPTINIIPDTEDQTKYDSESDISIVNANVAKDFNKSKLDIPSTLHEVSRANSKIQSYV